MRKIGLIAACLLMLLAGPAFGFTIDQDGVIRCARGEIPEFPDRIHQKLFDTAVNAGQARAIRLLQEALNAQAATLRVDGVIGPATRTAICGRSEQKILVAYSRRQEAFYRGIVARNPAQRKFLAGWLGRAAWIPD
jgi:lysozyme family protein